jgi:hypothetical protein
MGLLLEQKETYFLIPFWTHTWIKKLCQVLTPFPHPTHIDPPTWPFGVSGQVFPSAHQFTFSSISHKGFPMALENE